MKKLVLLLLFILPYGVMADELIPNANSGVLIEVNSGKIFFEKEKDKQVSVASMTKMVAQIIIMEEIEAGHIHWNDVVTASRNASDMGGSQIYLEANEKMTVEDLMKGISVASGNDATVAMAEYISGSEAKFVRRMNDKVQELGLKNTHFENCTGLDEKNHYSSSYDMAMIARELITKHPDIIRFSSIYEDYLREDTNRKFWLVNTNKLISQYSGTDGLKTGHTDDAGYCIAATAKRDGLRLIAIVLGEKDSRVRNTETMKLLDYGFLNIKLKTLKKKGDIIQEIHFSKAKPKDVKVVLKNDLNVVEEIDQEGDYQFDVDTSSISLPIKTGSVVGKVNVTLNGKIISSEDIIVLEDVSKLSIYDIYYQNIKKLLEGYF